MGRLASARAGSMTTSAIRWFVARYRVDMREAAEPDIARYESFNAFFTRPLAPGVRAIADAAFVCPVDGAISQCGAIAGDQIFQAKGHAYSTTALVGGDTTLAGAFTDGTFATIYLSPRDYHRIHMPCDGTLRRMIHVPGDLFSVNPTTARGVPGLFARNERVVCVFDGADGPFVLVLVGATIVGSMATVWHGVVNPPRPGVIREWTYDDRPIVLRKGEEMGRFLLGSTVVLLFGRGRITLDSAWQAARAVRMGESMAERVG
jgi:phosphatidylserine decarboxylase